MLVEILISYFIGSINSSYILGKLLGVDISKTWDKNLGATNLYMSLPGDKRKKIIISSVSAIFDVLKGVLPALLFGPIYAAFAVVGHCFSLISYYFTKRIPTGCGIATSIGWELVYIPYAAVITLILLLVYSHFLKKKYQSIRDEMGYVSIQIYSAVLGLCFVFSYSILIGMLIWGGSVLLARVLRVFE